MSNKLPSPCAMSGCPVLCVEARCPEHSKTAHNANDANRGTPTARGHGYRWQRLKRMVLNRMPLCPCGRSATIADHIVPKSAGGEDCMHNLQGLCKSCHDRKSRTEDANYHNDRFRRGGRE